MPQLFQDNLIFQNDHSCLDLQGYIIITTKYIVSRNSLASFQTVFSLWFKCRPKAVNLKVNMTFKSQWKPHPTLVERERDLENVSLESDFIVADWLDKQVAKCRHLNGWN